MNLECPKCKQRFELSSDSFEEERFNLSTYINCLNCGYTLPSLEFVREDHWSEFIDWVNNYNDELVKKKEKKHWEVIVHDRGLRLQLVKEGILSGAAGDPFLRLILHCVKPDKTFVLRKFKEHTIATYKHGFIDPIIRIHPAMRIMDHETCIEL